MIVSIVPYMNRYIFLISIEFPQLHQYVEKSEYAVTSNELKNQFDIPIQLFLSCIGYQ